MRQSEERTRLSANARAILKVLRHEWEMASSDLRTESGIADRAAFTRALDELIQRLPKQKQPPPPPPPIRLMLVLSWRKKWSSFVKPILVP